MIVRMATEEDREEWTQWLATSPGGSFYHDWGWLDLLESELRHEALPVLAEHRGRIVGVLPLVGIRSWLFGRNLCSMPFVNYGGPVGESAEVEEALARFAVGLANARGPGLLELRSLRSFDGFHCETHKVSMEVSLPDDSEALWASFSSKHRTNIRRVYKDGVLVKSGGKELLNPFYKLMEKSWRALGTPLYSLSFFDGLLSRFPDRTRIFVAFQGTRPVATALNGEAGTTVEGMWAAADPAYRSVQPNYTLYWEMLEDACQRGFKTYHLGRSTAGSGAARFKEKWGATPRQLYWNSLRLHRGSTPELRPENPRFRLAIETWRRLPIPVLRLVGPPIARLIP